MKKYFLSLPLFIIVFTNNATAQESENIFTFKVGDIEISTLSEGQQQN